MTMKKVVAVGILASIGVAVLTAIMMPINEDAWYELAGLGFMVFGVWGAVLLLKE